MTKTFVATCHIHVLTENSDLNPNDIAETLHKCVLLDIDSDECRAEGVDAKVVAVQINWDDMKEHV